MRRHQRKHSEDQPSSQTADIAALCGAWAAHWHEYLVHRPQLCMGWLSMNTAVLQGALFKAVQISVAAFFTLLVWVQTFVAGFGRLFGDPAALVKVQQARQAAVGLTALSGPEVAADEAAPAALQQQQQQLESSLRQRAQQKQQQHGAEDACGSSGPVQPVHVFPQPELGHDSDAWKLVGPYMKQYGRHAIANSQLCNPEFIHFFMPGMGSLPYVIIELYNRAIVFGIGEPLAHRSQWRHLTELFLAEFPEAYFHHITEEFADLLHGLGYYVNSAGSETTLQVQSWAYTGKTRTVRAAARAARDAGVRVRELAPEELTDEMRHKLQHDVSGDWQQQKSIADRHLRVYVRNVDYDTMQLRDGVRIFVAESYDPSCAPPAEVDPVLQGAALNAKPPKPPRMKRSNSAAGPQSLSRAASSAQLSRAASSAQLSTATSTGSLISLPSLTTPPGIKTWLAKPQTQEDTAAAGSGKPSAAAAAAAAEVAAPAAVTAVRSNSGGCSGDEAASGSNTSSPKSTCGVVVSVTATALAADPKLIDTKPAAAAEAPAAAAAVQSGQQERGREGSYTAEVVGFVLLDPLWEGGVEVGYVTSMMRMKRSAHTGTLKLLIEDIISKLRKEGCKELTFGFAPLFNLRDSHTQWRHIHWLTWVQQYIYWFANNVYAFKNLAFSKVRYGAGLDDKGGQYRDPNVTLSNVYMAGRHYMPGFNILDLYAFLTYIGLVDTPSSTFAKLVGLTKGGENLTK